MTPLAEFCQACGHDGSLNVLTMTWNVRGDFECLCSACEGFVEAGMLRREIDDEGHVRYRQWHFQPMTPGDLLPRAEAP